jgi:two-component system chemotaxis response regulator CheB
VSGHDIIVVGASAGGVGALVKLAKSLPADLPTAVFVVLHIPAQTPSLLPDILNRAGPLHALHPPDNTEIKHGHIYIAPPDHHLLIAQGHVHIARGPRESRHRPAVDPLFRSAAIAYGPRVIGVVLTGALDDGTAGLLAIKQRGGIAVVQDPQDALYPGMPQSAVDHVQVDYCVPLADMGALLAGLVSEPIATAPTQSIGSEHRLDESLPQQKQSATTE